MDRLLDFYSRSLSLKVLFVFLISSSEEISRCKEMIQKLQNILESERENCGFVNEQRLKLQQENEELQKQTEDLRKSALEVQKKAKLKVYSNLFRLKCVPVKFKI